MNNWYLISEAGKERVMERQNKYADLHLIRANVLEDKERKKWLNRISRRSLTTLGRVLETWGQVLQKKFRTCQ